MSSTATTVGETDTAAVTGTAGEARGTWLSIAADTSLSCGLKLGGELWCWGEGGNNPASDAGEHVLVPAAVEHSSRFGWLDMGNHAGCAVEENGRGWCWGRNWGGILGNGDTEDRDAPTEIAGDLSWLTVSIGVSRTLGLASDGTAWRWGHGLADIVPTQMDTWDDWIVLEAGNRVMCGIRDDGSAWCWGVNEDGSLGDGTNEWSDEPVQVAGDRRWRALSTRQRRGGAPSGTVCAIAEDDSLWCWGTNDRGQVGDGTRENRNAPIQVGVGRRWASVSAADHTCAIDEGGALHCWGGNAWGQLGIGTHGEDASDQTADELEPVLVSEEVEWREVSVGVEHTCAVARDDSGWCWGHGRRGILGNGSEDDSPIPLRLPD